MTHAQLIKRFINKRACLGNRRTLTYLKETYGVVCDKIAENVDGSSFFPLLINGISISLNVADATVGLSMAIFGLVISPPTVAWFRRPEPTRRKGLSPLV